MNENKEANDGGADVVVKVKQRVSSGSTPSFQLGLNKTKRIHGNLTQIVSPLPHSAL